MTPGAAREYQPAPQELLTPEMFGGPAALRGVMPILRVCPPTLGRRVVATLAVVDGVVRRGRYAEASAWAAAQGFGAWKRQRVALALLANHGRFVAEEALLGVETTKELARDVTVLGGERLTAYPGGALLLGFHLGPPKTWLRLRALGYPVCFAGRLATTLADPRWQAAVEAGVVIRLPEGEPASRVQSLLRMRRRLEEGALVYVTGDGPFGREAIRIDLPGSPLALRAGWLALRRATGVPTLPVLTWQETGRRIIAVHPPLPPPEADPSRDAAACLAVLAPLVREYVRRHPTQCRWLAMPRWNGSPVGQDPPEPADQQVGTE